MEPQNLFSLALPDDEATKKLGRDLSLIAQKQDLFALVGDLGAGKTTLARAFIKHFINEPDLEVPSPTFNLVLEYKEQSARAPLYHYDLYRMGDADELQELGFDEALSHGITLVEWPENAGDMLGQNYLAIQLVFDETGEGRIAHFYGAPSWRERWDHFQKIEQFLQKNIGQNFSRHHMMGDASLRHYERIELEDKTLILMNDPERDGGPTIRDGKTYPEIAHITLSIPPFVAICNLLQSKNYCAPKLIDFDLDAGLILLEFLGADTIVTDDKKAIDNRYEVAVKFLADFHQHQWPNSAPITEDKNYHIPPFDADAMMIEIELFLDWYAPRFAKDKLDEKACEKFKSIWKCLIDKAQSAEDTLLMRDYHSPNIIWREEKTGFDKIGLIDFQDAMIGPTSYDVISICNDARVDISQNLEQNLIKAYVTSRKANDAQFDEEIFMESYAIMAAHRATKILGGFVRSDERDGKPTYLAYLPRMRDYLSRALKHPSLHDYNSWIIEHDLL